MGSIPIIVLDEEYQDHACPNALYPLWESVLRDTDAPDKAAFSPIKHLEVLQRHAPFVILKNWTHLEQTLDHIYQESDETLNRRQQRVLEWYQRFMQERVWKLEDYLVGA